MTKLTALATMIDVVEAEHATGLTVYAADTPNTHKVSIILEELGVPYNVALINISKDVQKESWHLVINPNGRTPTLVDRSVSPAFSVFESGAILLYLARKFADQGGATLLPSADPVALSEVEQWLMWQMSALGPMLGNCMYFKRIAAPMVEDLRPLQFGIDRYEKESLRLYQVLENRLSGGRKFLCGAGNGEYSLADIACFPYAQMHWWTGVSEQVGQMPGVMAWLARIAARPAVQHGLLVPSGRKNWQLSSDGQSMREAVESNAAKYGREHFGWRDIAEVNGDDNQRPAGALAAPNAKL